MRPRFRARSPEKRIQPRSVALVFRRLGRHLRRHRLKLIGAAVCMAGVTATGLLQPWPLKIIFDGILMPQDEPGAFMELVLGLTGDMDLLLALSALSILAIAILGGLLGFGQAYLVSSVAQRVVASIRQQLFTHIQRLSHSFHDERSLGDLLARLGEDVRSVRVLLVNAIFRVSAIVLKFVGTLGIMLLMDWWLTLVALAVVPVLALAVWRINQAIKGAVKRQRRRSSKIMQVMSERISAIRLVQAFAREAHEEARFSRQNRRIARAGIAAARHQAHLGRLVQVIIAIGTCGVIWFGVTRVQAGAITPGDLIVFMAYLTGLYRPIRKFAAFTGKISRATVCGGRILSILDLDPEIKDAPGAVPAPRFRGEIVLENVAFAYTPGRPVFRALDLRVAPGETVALAGESGSGKSTIASLLLRFYDPVAGSVRIDGTDIRAYTLESLR